MTTPAEERSQQRRWRLRPRFAALPVFDQLLENEFRPPEAHLAAQTQALRALVRFAATHTPYYADLLARASLRPEDIASANDLPRLPALTKQEALNASEALRARSLPPDEIVFGVFSTSGTTGQPLRVLHTQRSNAMFTFLAQRGSRWWRVDPAWSRVEVRPGHYLAAQPGAPPNADGVVIRRPHWGLLGQCFETGPEYAFNVSNPMEQQVAWVKELQPRCALADPGVFEEWLLANQGEKPVDSLAALLCVGSQLPPSLRTLLEERYGAPVHEGFGLNEVGMVATRCPSGRYHVHAEHCIVELTDDQGQPCVPGQTGHLLVTGLNNFAMPLIRYDTGDLALALDGPCPCGRTLPSFGPIVGRFRRYAGLPPGTRERFQAIRHAVEQHPPAALAFLRRYQIHQDLRNRFTLRLCTAGPVPPAFADAIQRTWLPCAGLPALPLEIVVVDAIPPGPGGKLLDFVSDFHAQGPSPDSPPPGDGRVRPGDAVHGNDRPPLPPDAAPTR